MKNLLTIKSCMCLTILLVTTGIFAMGPRPAERPSQRPAPMAPRPGQPMDLQARRTQILNDIKRLEGDPRMDPRRKQMELQNLRDELEGIDHRLGAPARRR